MVHPHLRGVVAAVEVAVVVILEVEVVVVDMVVVEVVVMVGVEAVNLMVVELATTMVGVGVGIGVVSWEKKKVGMVRFLRQHPNLIMEGLAETLHHLTTHMARAKTMEQMQFLHQQAMLEVPHHIHNLMVVPLRVVMVMVRGMLGVATGVAHLVDMTVVVVLVVEVDIVLLLLRLQLR